MNADSQGLRGGVGKPAPPPVSRFEGKFEFLSNFWPVEVNYQGIIYPSVEHAFQAAKTLDLEEREWIGMASRAATAKRRGRSVTLRPHWDQMRVAVMRDLIAKKFLVGSDLANRLLDTGEQELREGNGWGDAFWGIYNGRGENWLGRLLMERRDVLRQARALKGAW